VLSEWQAADHRDSAAGSADGPLRQCERALEERGSARDPRCVSGSHCAVSRLHVLRARQGTYRTAEKQDGRGCAARTTTQRRRRGIFGMVVQRGLSEAVRRYGAEAFLSVDRRRAFIERRATVSRQIRADGKYRLFLQS